MLSIGLISLLVGPVCLAANISGIIGMGFHMLFEVLRAFERFPTKLAAVRLQRNMDADVGRDMVALHDSYVTVAPSTLQIEIIGALSTDVTVADVILMKTVRTARVRPVRKEDSRRALRRWVHAHRSQPTGK